MYRREYQIILKEDAVKLDKLAFVQWENSEIEIDELWRIFLKNNHVPYYPTGLINFEKWVKSLGYSRSNYDVEVKK